MTRNGPPALLWGKLAWHPAVKAWSEVADDPVVPESIEVLRPGSQSAIYRLMGAGPDGGNVVARQVPVPQAALERAVYEDILPHLPVAAPREYGCWADGEHGSWLFLEDVGGERCGLADREHRALAARWVGRLHTEATRIVAAQTLPEAGPPRYLEHLWAGRRAIRAQLANPALTAGPVDELQRVDLPTYWSTVRARWPDVAFADVRRLAGVGRLFRRLAAVRRLAEPAADSPGRLGLVLASLQSLHVRLADAARALHSHCRE